MRKLFYTLPLLLAALPLAAQARWEVKSEFQLQLTESLFDKVIEDFWQSLSGTQSVPIPNFTINPGLPIQISGITAEMNYAFPVPKRTNANTREWTLASNQLGARITVANISASQIVDRIIDGVRYRVKLDAECHNVSLRLKPGLSAVAATIRAEVLDGQVKLSMPSFNADWQQGAWEVESISCSGTEGLDVNVREYALNALASFQNFDAQVRGELETKFVQWSKDASILLLSERELPTQKDYLKLYYEPKNARESGGGLMLEGQLRFVYPYVAPNQNIVQEFKLGVGTAKTSKAAAQTTAIPQLMMPFATIRALMMGEYFAGKLEYSLRSYEIPAFQEFMQSRWKQFWAWPDLMKFPTNTTFAFNFVPNGPPSFDNEKATDADTISGDLTLPLAIRMFAPVKGTYIPYVEFRTLLQGQSKMKLQKGGKVDFLVTTDELPMSYSWAKQYVAQYNPTKRIAAQTMADAAKESLSAEGLTLAFPTFVVGKALKLVPEHWQLQSGGNLGLQFTTESSKKK